MGSWGGAQGSQRGAQGSQGGLPRGSLGASRPLGPHGGLGGGGLKADGYFLKVFIGFIDRFL